MRPLLAIALLASLLGAGCLAATPPAAPSVTPGVAPFAGAPPAVIAVVDSGANPYHVAFRGAPTFAEVPGFSSLARAVELTLDARSYDEAVAADAQDWATVKEGELVWFPGTRLASVSLHADADAPAPGLDANGHGTVVSHAALAAAPRSVVLLVQVGDDEHLPDAMRWIARQSWIDVVSVSSGTHPGEILEGEVLMGLPEAYAEVARSGKLLLNGAGNYPWPHFLIEHPAPPFVIAVGGAREGQQGDAWIASRVPDVVSAFVHDARAVAGTLDGMESTAGTSLATPWAAGALAEALWLVRDAVGARGTGVSPDGALVLGEGAGALEDGKVTADEVREAMNRAAAVWGPADWKTPDTGEEAYLWGVPVVVAPAQMGWGYVGPEQAPAIAGHLLGTQPLPEKPPEFTAFMRATMTARTALWGGA